MRRGRETAGRAIAGFLVLFGGATTSGGASAADVRLRAVGDCAQRTDIVEQVDGLLGRPVGAVDGFDFDVDIAERPDRRWRLRLVTIDRASGAKRSREIDGAGCVQLADAAAVAIAMSIQSNAAQAPAPPAPPVPPEASELAARPTPSELRRLQLSMGIGALGDVGALPHPGFGLGLGASLGWRHLLLLGEGGLFASSEARLPDNSGGSFRLIVGAVLACFTQPLGQSGILGCAGGEVGIVQADGVGINRPRLRNTAWEAGRLEVGFTRRLNTTVSLFVRGGAAVPWSRPTFLVNGTELVHRPAAVTGRVMLGALFAIF